ncbi:MAG: hypothetical protein HC915_04240 [Anaerolineae bacterium]|nr:hypothetical protein [Anaerolineae bacterium]
MRAYTFDGDASFEEGITDCRTLQEGEAEQAVFFGWRYIITLLNGAAYEVRVSYNREILVICDEVTEEVAAAPAVSADPNLPGAVTAPLGRGTLELGGQVQVGNTSSQVFDLMRSAGMNWIKKQINPSNRGAATVYIQEAKANGFKIMLSVIASDKNTITQPAVQDEYAQYVASLAAAGADAIEVWNEANLSREWTRGQLAGASYVSLLAKSYNAIKAANPNTIVISAGVAPTGAAGNITSCTQNPDVCNDDVWYREVAAAGGANYMDCVGVHYNEGVVSPRQSSGDPRDNYPTRYYGTNMNRALAPFPGKQACITEIGYVSPDGYGTLPVTFAWGQNTSREEQAQWLAEAVDIAQAAGNVRVMIVFNVNLTAFTDDPQAGYAIIDRNGQCTACAALRAAMTN